MFSVDHRRDTLTTILLAEDPAPGLWELVDSGTADEVVPELTGLRLEQDPIHRHKDVLAHTIAVVSVWPGLVRTELVSMGARETEEIGRASCRERV